MDLSVKSALLGAALCLAATSATRADVFTFTFTGPNVSGSGTLTGNLTGTGMYNITGASGTISDTAAGSAAPTMTMITTVTGQGVYASNDNTLYFPAQPNSNQGYSNSATFFDTGGIDFETSSGILFNLSAGYPNSNQYYLTDSANDPAGNAGNGVSPQYELVNSVTVAPAAVGAPAPLAGAGLLSFFGVGGLAVRRRAKRFAVSLFAKRAALT